MAIETNEFIDVKELPPFKRFIMSIGAIPTSYLESMTYAELLMWFCDYLQNTVLPTINNNADALQEVIDYLQNLGIQDFVNEKLDEMAEDGTLEELLGDKAVKKLDYYEITDQTEEEIQEIFNIEKAKVISFKNDYTFTSTKRLNANTTLLLNNHTLTFDIPSVIEDYSLSHGFFNFKDSDVFLKYNGNGNIKIANGILDGGNCSFIHGANITFENLHFINCKNDHILELCAMTDIKIINCTFEGTPVQSSIGNMSKEDIQWENATQSNFPHFTDSLSATYDNTACQNITIDNCTFKKPSDISYEFYTAIGNHNEVLLYPHQNIIIKNCLFDNPRSVTINFYNTNNVIIENNIFNGNNLNAISDYTCHIRTRNICNNVEIRNNKFKQSFRAIENSPNNLNYNWTIENNAFEDYNLNNQDYPSTTYAIVDLDSIINLTINNNYFTNFLQKCIHLDNTQISTHSELGDDYPQIISNNFNPTKNLNSNMIHISYGHVTLLNNIYNVSGFVNNYHYIIQAGGSTNLKEIISKNNVFNNYIITNSKYIERNATNNYWYNKIFDIPFTAYYTDQTGGNNLSFNYNVFSFNAMRLCFTSTNGTYSYNINSWDATRKLDARAYVIPVDTTFVKLTINNDGTFNYDANSTSVHLRSIYFLNNDRNI